MKTELAKRCEEHGRVPSTESAHLLSNFDSSQLDCSPQHVPILPLVSHLPLLLLAVLYKFYLLSRLRSNSHPTSGSSLITPAVPPHSCLWILQYLLDVSKSSCSLNYQVWETDSTWERALVFGASGLTPLIMGFPKSVMNISDGQFLPLEKL